MPTWEVERIFGETVSRLEWEVSRLQRRDIEWAATKPAGRSRQDHQSRVERAFSFIFVSGALEELFRQLTEDLPKDLQRVEVRPRDLRLESFSLMFPKAWEATSSDRVVRFVKRKKLMDLFGNFYAHTQPVDLSGISNLGLMDGRTVDVHHFEALWEGLCLSTTGDSFWVTGRHRQSIQTVHDKRNVIAHFETDPRIEGFRFSYLDLTRLVADVLACVQRLEEHTLLWLDRYEV